MTVREIVAERVSGLKKRLPVEAPIIDEVPLRATIISSRLFALPEVDGIIPVIVRGKAYGEIAGRWYRVFFPRAIKDPSVVAVGEARRGVIPTPKVPTIAIPTVTIGVASAEVPKAAEIVVRKVDIGHVPTSLGRFRCGWAIASLTDGLNDLMETLESVMVKINRIIDDVKAGFDEIRSSLVSLDEKVDDLRGKANDALDKLRRNTETSTNSGLDSLRGKTESAVNTALASVIPLLYDVWGVPRNMAITPIHVRNVLSTGFEFQSYGKTTCYYIAVGSLL